MIGPGPGRGSQAQARRSVVYFVFDQTKKKKTRKVSGLHQKWLVFFSETCRSPFLEQPLGRNLFHPNKVLLRNSMEETGHEVTGF